MHRFRGGGLLMAPPVFGDPHFALPDEHAAPLFDEDAGHPDATADQDDADPLPPYMAQLFEVAGVPTSLSNGQVLLWSDATWTSTRFVSAQVQVEQRGAWVEFTLVWTSGRCQRLRTTRYLEVVVLQDCAGLWGDESVNIASGRLMLDFRDAVQELMVRH